MSEIVKGRGVRVEVGFTEGASYAVQAVSQSNPAEVTATGFGALGSVAYFDEIEGMDQLDGQPVRIQAGGSPTSAAVFLAEDIDSSGFADFVSGVLVPVTSWRTLAQSTQYQLGGGAPKTEDVGTLIDTTEKLETIKLAAETVTIDLRSLTEDNEALAKIRNVARQLGRVVIRITLADGAQRLFRGQPSIPGESVQQGATGTGQLTITVKGQICYLTAL